MTKLTHDQINQMTLEQFRALLSDPLATTSAAGLVELATDAEFDTGSDTERYASVAQIRKRVPLGFKNLLINGAFFIKQRSYASGEATTGANQYTLDRWRVVTSGEALSWSDSGGKRTVTAPSGGIEQVVEGTWLQSGTYAISWTGTATCTVGGTARTSGEAFSITGGSNVTVKFIDGTVANAQLELGGCATPFELRPYGVELRLCQRYFWKGAIASTLALRYCGTASSTAMEAGTMPLSMRSTPTLSIVTAPTMDNCTSAALTTGSADGFVLRVTVTAAGTYRAYSGIYSADAEL